MEMEEVKVVAGHLATVLVLEVRLVAGLLATVLVLEVNILFSKSSCRSSSNSSGSRGNSIIKSSSMSSINSSGSRVNSIIKK